MQVCSNHKRNCLVESEVACTSAIHDGKVLTFKQVGLDVFGIGEHHRSEFVDSAPAVILGTAATRTTNIRLTSAVTVLSAVDPVRIFQEFATLDLISHGRAEIVAGRGSSVEAFPLFGFDLDDYDSLFSEKLDLLLKIRENTHVSWSGKHRPALTGQAVYPRPLQNPLPIWVGVARCAESSTYTSEKGKLTPVLLTFRANWDEV
jgi:alkanesulfonate monooxygenase SsuD/methylene tetrahydromethanopterin reductase-like flavin-dependent oxidoreductase (luciferase family)